MTDAYSRPIVDQEAAHADPATRADATAVFQTPASEPQRTESRTPARSGVGVWSRDLRFMLVVLAAIVVLFLAFALLIAFSPTDAAISALAVIAAPIATMVAAYYGISLALRQVSDARHAAEAAEARVVGDRIRRTRRVFRLPARRRASPDPRP